MLSPSNLHAYQRKAIKFILSHNHCALWLGLGLGKTGICLSALEELINGMEVGRVLVVAPLRVCSSVWRQEAAKWSHTSNLKINVCTGPAKDRIKCLMQPADIHIINRENITWLVDFYKRPEKWPFDMVVIDEASSFKSSSAKRFKALKKVRPYIKRSVQLTGTPASNGLVDLWSQAYLLDLGQRLGRTKTAYLQRFFQSDYMGYRYEPRPGAEKQIHGLLGDIVLSLQTEDYIDLPMRIDTTMLVTPPAEALRQYKILEKEFLLVLGDTDIEAMSAAALANKLLQFCIAEGTKVLTKEGPKEIEKISPGDEVWDGEEWVQTDGCIFQGIRSTIECYGVHMTMDHKVLTDQGWKKAKEIENGKPSERFNRHEVRPPEGFGKGWHKKQKGVVALLMRLWKRSCFSKPEPSVKASFATKILRMFAREMECNARNDQKQTVRHLAQYGESLPQNFRQGLQKLWCSWNICLRRVERFFCKFLERYENDLSGFAYNRKSEQQGGLFQRKLPLGYSERTIKKQKGQCNYSDGYGADVRCGCGRIERYEKGDSSCKNIPIQTAPKGLVQVEKRKVYDLLNCGPRSRFVVLDDESNPLIVHNCNGAVYDETGITFHVLHDAKIDALRELVEDNAGEPMLVAYSYKSDLARIRAAIPSAVVLDKDQSTIDRWNRGEIPILLVHPASAGHGLNLQAGGALLVWFGMCWSLENYEQLCGRLHRQGQTRPVRVIHLVAEGMLDAKVLGCLAGKAKTQNELLLALKKEML